MNKDPERRVSSIPSTPTAAVTGNTAATATGNTVKVTYLIPNALHLTAIPHI